MRRKSRAQLLVAILLTIVLSSSFGVLVFLFNQRLSVFAINGSSMSPYLNHGESVVLAQEEKVARGQIVFFRSPVNWFAGSKTFVKRIAAVPGDTLSFTDRTFRVNGEVVSQLPAGYDCSLAPQSFSVTLNSRQILVFGDNVSNSTDSRKMFCTGNLDKMFIEKQYVLDYGHIVGRF